MSFNHSSHRSKLVFMFFTFELNTLKVFSFKLRLTFAYHEHKTTHELESLSTSNTTDTSNFSHSIVYFLILNDNNSIPLLPQSTDKQHRNNKQTTDKQHDMNQTTQTYKIQKKSYPIFVTKQQPEKTRSQDCTLLQIKLNIK